MRRMLAAAVLGLTLCPHPAAARTGSLLDVSVDVSGRATPLYPAPDGSARLYLEARAGAPYAVRLQNRTGARVGVQLVVDGLNVIDGRREAAGTAGRLYVLDAYASTTISGWRTSLAEVRGFTFVDERRSYAARTNQANGHLGWIEVAVFREQAQAVLQEAPWEDARERDEAPPAAKARPGAAADAEGGAAARTARPAAPAAAGSFPGTGWGRRMDDRVTVVEFDPEPVAAERTTLRYEYAAALRALGIPVRPNPDRLAQRERGDQGFARSPLW